MRNFPTEYDLQRDDVLYFCHIPKTAGMTFRTILEDFFPCKEICPATLKNHINTIPQDELDQHRLFRGHLISVDLPKVLANKRVVNVSVLREPVSRVISHYEYVCRTPGDPHYAEVKSMTLEDFTKTMTVGRVGKNVQVYHVAKALKFNLEKLPPDEVLQLALDSIDTFAFAGLLDRFQDSLFLLSYIFGWKPILNSRRENAAKSTKIYEQVPESTLELIRESTQLDMALYQHAKKIFEERFALMNQSLLERYGHLVLDQCPASADEITSEMRLALLEKHAEQRYAEQQIPPASSLVYDFCQSLRGAGWHRRECPPQGLAHRWMGPEPKCLIDFPLATDQDLTVEFRIILAWAIPSDILDSLTLEVNGHPIALTTLYSEPDSRLFQGKIPQAYLKSDRLFTQLVFKVNQVVSLKVVNPLSNDSRSVGLAFNLIQLFPAGQEREKSAMAFLFDCNYWKDTADFVRNHLQEGDRVVAPLPFRVQLPCKVLDYNEGFAPGVEPQWVVLNKGAMSKISSILVKLITRGYSPVFANEVFVVFVKGKPLPKISYLSAHVRSLYVDRLKFYVKSYVEQRLKPLYERYNRRKARLKKRKK